jgi:ATP-dependent DNA helicase DinG
MSTNETPGQDILDEVGSPSPSKIPAEWTLGWRPDWSVMVPEVTLRPQQIEALERTWDALQSGAEVVFIEAPTGVGKSIIILALCRAGVAKQKSSFMVTPQRALQAQLGVWDGNEVMKGRGSYSCNIADVPANKAPCVISSDVRKDRSECSNERCPYYNALETAKEADIVVHNYASLMAQTHIGNHFGGRDLLCLDEAHTAVGWIRNYLSFTLSRVDLEHLTNEAPPRDPQWFTNWLAMHISLLDTAELSTDNLPDGLVMTIMSMTAHRSTYGIRSRIELEESYQSYSEEATEENIMTFDQWVRNEFRKSYSPSIPWHTEKHEETRWGAERWESTPIRVAAASWVLTNLGRAIVMVTATVLNAKLMVSELGMGKKQHALVRITSAFPAKNRPVYKRYVGSMSYSRRSSTMPKMIQGLVQVLRDHPDEPGIIHTVSHKLAHDLRNGLLNIGGWNRTLELVPRGSARDEMISDFLSGALGPRAVLFGPALLEGIDGKDDSLRWQALCKVPWPHRQSPVVKHLLDHKEERIRQWGSRWYTWKTAQQFVQGLGRICRTPTDHGVTYLMDSGFDKLLQNNVPLPQYIRDSIK